MTIQLGLADVGVDPTHWHILQGFKDVPDPLNEILVNSHTSLDDARSMLLHYRHEVLGYEHSYGVEVVEKSVTDDRIDYADFNNEDFQLGWLRIEKCDRWDCRELALEEHAE